MIETLIGFASLILFAIAVGYINGRTSHRLGSEEAMRKMADDSLGRIARGVEKLMVPRPNRSVLVRNWKRRLRKSTTGECIQDTTMPDPESGSD